MQIDKAMNTPRGIGVINSSLFFLGMALLPIFWVSVLSVGTFSIDLSFVGVLLLILVALRMGFLVLTIREFKYPIFLFLIAIFFYGVSSIYHGELRVTLLPFFVQFVFFSCFLVVGVVFLQVFNCSSSFFLCSTLAFSIISFFVFFLVSGDWSFIEFWKSLLLLDSQALVQITRSAFGYSLVENGADWDDMVNLQNKVAQHVFGFSFLYFCLSLKGRGRLFFGVRLMLMPLFLYCLLLLSGQVLAEVLVSVLLVSFFYTRMGDLKSLLALIVFSFVACFLLLIFWDTPFVQSWAERFSGDDLSTGRLDIWGGYISEMSVESVFFGLSSSVTHDAHSFWIAMAVEIGAWFSILAFLFIVYYLVVSVITYSRRLNVRNVFPIALSLSIFFHYFIALSIGGSNGFLGFSEFYKLPALVVFIAFFYRNYSDIHRRVGFD